MPSFIQFVNSKLKSYSLYVTIFIVVVVFCIASYYVYNNLKKTTSLSSPYQDVSNKRDVNSELEIIFFHVDWCPHCIKAKPEWDAFYRQTDGKVVNKCRIQCKSIDCTNDEDDTVSGLITTYKINSYPTVIILKEGKRYDFDAKITKYSLDQFVETVSKV